MTLVWAKICIWIWFFGQKNKFCVERKDLCTTMWLGEMIEGQFSSEVRLVLSRKLPLSTTIPWDTRRWAVGCWRPRPAGVWSGRTSFIETKRSRGGGVHGQCRLEKNCGGSRKAMRRHILIRFTVRSFKSEFLYQAQFKPTPCLELAVAKITCLFFENNMVMEANSSRGGGQIPLWAKVTQIPRYDWLGQYSQLFSIASLLGEGKLQRISIGRPRRSTQKKVAP